MILKHIKIGTWKLSLGGEAKRELYLTDRLTGLNLSSPPKKGCLFGKSHVSDFVRHIPRNTLLTKVLNHYFELNFCRQCIYQWQTESVISVAWINYLLFQLCKTVSVKVLGGALTGKMNLLSGYTLNTLDINRWPSLGLGVDPAAPRLASEREFRMQGGSALNLVTQWNGFSFAAYQTPLPHLTWHYGHL